MKGKFDFYADNDIKSCLIKLDLIILKSKASTYDTAGYESNNGHDQILNDAFSIF